jgi:DNA-binding transcriptional LysR family regulator
LRDIDEQSLIIVPPPFDIPSFTFVLVWHKRRGSDQALKWLNAQIERASADIDWRPFTQTAQKDFP